MEHTRVSCTIVLEPAKMGVLSLPKTNENAVQASMLWNIWLNQPKNRIRARLKKNIGTKQVHFMKKLTLEIFELFDSFEMDIIDEEFTFTLNLYQVKPRILIFAIVSLKE